MRRLADGSLSAGSILARVPEPGSATSMPRTIRIEAATLSFDDPSIVAGGPVTLERTNVRLTPTGDAWQIDLAGTSKDLGAVVCHAFAAPEDRAWLEQLLWPLVGARVHAWRQAESSREPPPPALVVETPLLFEAGLDKLYDATLVIVADEAVRAERAAARGHAAVDERTARQLSQEEKAARADHVVRNDRDLATLEQELAAFLEKLSRRP